MRENDCRDFFKAVAKSKFFPCTCCSLHKMHDEKQPVFSKRILDIQKSEMLCLCSKRYCCYDNKSDKFKFSSKGLNKRVREDSGDGLMAKYRSLLDYDFNLTSTNREFRTVNPMVATYQQTKKGLRCFYPKSQAGADGIHKIRLKRFGVLVSLMMSYYIGFMILKGRILR